MSGGMTKSERYGKSLNLTHLRRVSRSSYQQWHPVTHFNPHRCNLDYFHNEFPLISYFFWDLMIATFTDTPHFVKQDTKHSLPVLTNILTQHAVQRYGGD